jgi:ATP-dependent exoDNAse (exonuclease V) beta subunit
MIDERVLEALSREAAREFAVAPAGDPGTVFSEARDLLARFVSSPLAASIAAAEILGREVPLLFPAEPGTAWRGTVDLVLRERDRIVVADYKTDRVEAAGVRSRAAAYGQQLTIYAEGVRQAMRLPELPVRRVLFLGPCVAVDL